ncbi:MAG: DUF2834 domain-containing protein [Rhodoferax sp.]
MSKTILACVLAAFSALTLYVLAQIGLWNVWAHNLNHPAGWQIFADLGIALGLFCTWMWRDARTQGRNPWLWTAFVFAVGSFGPLLYLLTRRKTAP